MLYRMLQSCYVFLLVCCLFVPVVRTSALSNRVPHALADFPNKGDAEDGNPPSNPQVILPRPDDSLSDKVLSSPDVVASATSATPGLPAGRGTLFGLIIISIGVLIVALIGIRVVMQRRRNAKL